MSDHTYQSDMGDVMDLLFKREQTSGKLVRVNFKLWSKIELEEDEKEIVDRYRFNEAILIAAIQPNLLRKTILVAVGAFVLVAGFISMIVGFGTGFILGILSGGCAGYWYLNENRETIFVKDLLHGRYFSCDSVVELARKEAWLETVVAFLRQVMESAKHWDGTQRHKIEPLPKEEGRQFILKGI